MTIFEERKACFERSKGKHLCCSCEYCPAFYIEGTTQDTNSCDHFWASHYGNDKPGAGVFSHTSFATEDNGGGYWVTVCPYYERDRELYLNLLKASRAILKGEE